MSRIPALPEPSRWVTDGNTYAVENYGSLVLSLILQTLLSCSLVAVWHWVHRGGKKPLVHQPAWAKVFRHDNPTSTAPEVRVKLSSGTVFWGRVADYTQTFDITQRELVLGPPLYVRALKGTRQPMDGRLSRLILKGDDIESIVVRYLEESPS